MQTTSRELPKELLEQKFAAHANFWLDAGEPPPLGKAAAFAWVTTACRTRSTHIGILSSHGPIGMVRQSDQAGEPGTGPSRAAHRWTTPPVSCGDCGQLD